MCASINTISKTLRIIFTTVEGFHNKSTKACFIKAATKSRFCKIAKSISTFDFDTLFTNIPFKVLFKKSPEDLSSNLKSENALTFLKHLSLGHLREPKKDIHGRNCCQCYFFHHKQMLLYYW